LISPILPTVTVYRWYNPNFTFGVLLVESTKYSKCTAQSVLPEKYQTTSDHYAFASEWNPFLIGGITKPTRRFLCVFLRQILLSLRYTATL